jgi:hypothetical protein
MGRPKGMRKTGGRKPGSKNKQPAVAELLAERGINPAERLIRLAEDGDLKDHQRASVWQTLLEYSQPKPVFDGASADDEPNPADTESTEELLKALSAKHEANDRAKDS